MWGIFANILKFSNLCYLEISGIINTGAFFWFVSDVFKKNAFLHFYWVLVHHEALVRYLTDQHIPKSLRKRQKKWFRHDIIGQISVLPECMVNDPVWEDFLGC